MMEVHMSTVRHVATSLVIAVFSCCFLPANAVTVVAAPASSSAPPVVSGSSTTTTTLTINGSNFTGGTPTVTVGNSAPLAVSTQTATQLVATLPLGLGAGTYALYVQIGSKASNSATSVVTIGAVGPQGPQGPAGPQGPQGQPGASAGPTVKLLSNGVQVGVVHAPQQVLLPVGGTFVSFGFLAVSAAEWAVHHVVLSRNVLNDWYADEHCQTLAVHAGGEGDYFGLRLFSFVGAIGTVPQFYAVQPSPPRQGFFKSVGSLDLTTGTVICEDFWLNDPNTQQQYPNGVPYGPFPSYDPVGDPIALPPDPLTFVIQ
jgi:hypothetical protein